MACYAWSQGRDLGFGPIQIQMLAPHCVIYLAVDGGPVVSDPFPGLTRQTMAKKPRKVLWKTQVPLFDEQSRKKYNNKASETFIIAVQLDLSWLNEYMNGNMLNI